MKKYFFLIILLAFFFIPIHSYADISDFVIDNADTVANWTSSDSVDTPISQETSVKQEDTGSVKVTTTATTGSTIDLMEYSSDANAEAAFVSSYIGMSATGGTVTTSGSYSINTFTSSGTLAVTGSDTAQVLVVAGGGGGGSVNLQTSGGGGAGGVIQNNSYVLTSGSKTVTIGNGGAINTNGQNSVFDTLTAIGGGHGGGGSGVAGAVGGSGGGGNSGSAGGAGTAGQGYAGSAGSGTGYPGGAGGGAAEAGHAQVGSNGGENGGNGIQSSISGTATYYGGGGGGAAGYASPIAGGIGGLGGGGNGSVTTGGASGGGVPGTPNTGGGGGGSNNYSATGIGGSGIVIVRYPTSPVLQSYSEGSIKTQGSYSLKVVAKATNSLSQTLIHTISSPLDLSNNASASFDIRSTSTGSNIKIGLHDTGGTTTEITPNITVANTFQTVSWDLSGVSNANKDAIDKIIITIVNADADNTFYIDNFTSLKTSLNNTVTYTTSAQNLSTSTNVTFWIRSTLAGSTLRFQFGEAASNEQTYNITINNANTWEKKPGISRVLPVPPVMPSLSLPSKLSTPQLLKPFILMISEPICPRVPLFPLPLPLPTSIQRPSGTPSNSIALPVPVSLTRFFMMFPAHLPLFPTLL